MVHKLKLERRQVWLKHYHAPGRLRRMLIALWNALSRRLGLVALMSPPPHSPSEAREIEQRRLAELHANGANVPAVVGEGSDELLLSDLGVTLSHCIRQIPTPEGIDRLVALVASDMARLHRNDGYLGQAFPRNITVARQVIGFIDFEEDPLEVMTLPQAQARDWIMLTTGLVKYYEKRSSQLVRIIREATARIDNEVRRIVLHVAAQLHFLERRWVRSRYAVAIAVLRQAFAPPTPSVMTGIGRRQENVQSMPTDVRRLSQ